ncbi:hypothetical protein TcYC6_0078230 [Trypanosoma cruzi]|nr:hypothetical protein TcYC6_0078230 [Trypanosoma cruzi]
MFRFSYRFMARPALRKGAAKAPKAVKVQPVKCLTQPAASINNASVVPPLEVVPPRMPSLGITPPSHATAVATDAGKVKAASLKKTVKKPTKKPAKVAKSSHNKPTKSKAEAETVTPKLTPKKPMKLKSVNKPKTKEVPKEFKAAKSKVPKKLKSKPKRK